jgi:hypothetical protein
MNEIILDESVAKQLRTAVEPLTVVDGEGKRLGYFTPIIDPSEYEGLIPHFSEEELRQADQEEGGRPLAEILADLQGHK